MLLNENVSVAHLELEEFRQKYNEIFDFSPAGLFILEDTGLILKVNNAGAKLFGLDKASLIKKSFSRFIAPDYQREFSHYRKRLVKKMIFQTCELKLLQRYRPLFYAQLLSKASLNAKTNSVEILIVIAATANRKKSEEANYQLNSDNINSIGLPAYSMVNDLNQPLAVIANYIYGCIHRLENGNYQINNLLQAMRQAEQELHRTAEIIMRMKNFSCKDIFKYEYICVSEVVNEIISIINYEIIEYPVTIVFKPIKGLPKTMLDRVYIQQALLNIARNAIEAMQEIKMQDPKLIIEINQPRKDTLHVNVIDNGPAFELDILHKLYEPHFTTKPHGIGLGLLISRIIVESHGGKLLVELNVTRGVCFTVALPIYSSEK